jgi:hypothetical protein
MKFSGDEDALWDSLGGGPSEGDLKPVEKKAPAKATGKIRARLEKAASAPGASEATPFEKEHPRVVTWLKRYPGNFEFYLSVRAQYERNGTLSEKQVAAIYRAIARDEERVGVAVTPLPSSIVIPPPAPRIFTLAIGEVLLVKKFAAKRIAAEAGLARPHFTMEVVEVSAETAKAYKVKLKMVAQRCSHCGICGLKLTDPRSVIAGIGPICADIYELPQDESALGKLSEILSVTKIVDTWIAKSAIRERYVTR